MAELLSIDGAQGEGGGQILRTCLSLSLCRGQAFEIYDIRARRAKPGLRPQHLAAVRAAARLSAAEVEGARLGSRSLRFLPGEVKPGHYHISLGTAGSTGLVLQTLLPALLTAGAPSSLTLEGGTHNPLAPPYDFLERAFVPLVNRMGPTVRGRLERFGFYPAGGGCCRFDITPAGRLRPLALGERGRVLEKTAEAIIANLPLHIAERELATVGKRLNIPEDQRRVEPVAAQGPGNALLVTVRSEHVTEVFTGFGERGVRAEEVARRVAQAVQDYLSADVPVGRHLADQLVVPFALAGSGAFLTQAPSRHLTTNIAVVKQFLDIGIECREVAAGRWRVAFGSPL